MASSPSEDRNILAAVSLDGDDPPSGAAAWCGSTGTLAVALLGRSASSVGASRSSSSSFSSSSSSGAFARPPSAEVALLDLERPHVRERDRNSLWKCLF